jgi:cleavage and polyadenylation specificity factor subunit 4
MPVVPDRLLSIGTRMLTRTVSRLSALKCFLFYSSFCASPKPNLPSPKSYEPPSLPSTRDLGPPPPGYGRYADFDRSGAGSGAGGMHNNAGGTSGPQRRNLDDVLCFKVGSSVSYLNHILMSHLLLQCGEKGHYANHCRNRNVPGNRGGTERVRKYGLDE